jgi:hypothetical protein
MIYKRKIEHKNPSLNIVSYWAKRLYINMLVICSKCLNDKGAELGKNELS